MILLIAATVISYFWGQQVGQERAGKLYQEQTTIHTVEQLGQDIQSYTLINLEKLEELKALLKSRILSNKTALESQVADQESKNKLVSDAVFTANSVLKH